LDPLTVSFLLPVGISFYTFQTLSYVVDVYKGDIEAEHHFGYYATFISFFPQLVAGPIERTRNLLPQIKCRHRFDYEKATYGLKLMAWGYFKKLVIADVVATYTGKIFDNPISFNGENGFSFCIAAVFFSFQIYCDFSGYSDIAVGTAKLLGIDLMTNFKSPYFSQSIREFWNRWHISLSTWFRDYVYIPLGGNRVGKARHAFNLLVTFLVSGLWHGASWSFVVWGGIHGLGQALENRFLRGRAKSNRPLWAVFRMILVFVFCTVAWVFFASNSVHGAVYILAHMLRGISSPLAYVRHGFAYLGLGKGMVCKITLSICILLLYDFLALKGIDVIERIGQMHWSIRWGVYLLFLLLIFFWAEIGNNTFIYFQF
jgi:D-alanyl-lipoteichoic acid acyltransferase DltB (MBOAT superfamily)